MFFWLFISYDAKGVVSSGILLRWCGTGGETWRKHEKVIDNIIFFNFLELSAVFYKFLQLSKTFYNFLRLDWKPIFSDYLILSPTFFCEKVVESYRKS